ncbi:MAG: KilA-N domain-containing protein [Cyanobacteria bacterium P01_H01_bin.150]
MSRLIVPAAIAEPEHLVEAGHVNATQMYVSCGKKFNDYARLESTKSYWEGLAAETGFSVSVLVVSINNSTIATIRLNSIKTQNSFASSTIIIVS